jgi:hypothetical protein
MNGGQKQKNGSGEQMRAQLSSRQASHQLT